MATQYVGTIITPPGLKLLTQRQSSADWVELRLDAMLRAGATVEAIEKILRKRRVNVLLTPRLKAEGGVYPWKKGERLTLVRRWLPLVEAVDFELASLKELTPVYRSALQQNKVVILSGHSIQKTISAARLRHWVQQFQKKKATIYKLAIRVESARDLFPLALLLCAEPEHPWAVMGVGPMAAISRQILGTLGSRLVYGYLDKPAAPGQPSLKALRKAQQQKVHRSRL